MASRRGGDDRGRGSPGNPPRPGAAPRHAEPDELTHGGNPHEEKTRLRGPSVVDDLIEAEESDGEFGEKTKHGGALLAQLLASEAAHSNTEPTVDVKLPPEAPPPDEAPTAFSPFETSDVVTKKSQDSAAAFRKAMSRTRESASPPIARASARESAAPPIARSRESIPPPAARSRESIPPPAARRTPTPSAPPEERTKLSTPSGGRARIDTPPPERTRLSTPSPRGRASAAPPIASSLPPSKRADSQPTLKAPPRQGEVSPTVRASEPLVRAAELARKAANPSTINPIEATKVAAIKPIKPTPDPSHARAVAAAFANGTPNNSGVDLTPPPSAGPPQAFGAYRVLRPLGEGGMALVYEGEHSTLRRSVAIKVLRPELRAKREAIERFHAEALITSRFSHQGVVTIFDHGFDPTGAAYLVMELLRGESLADRLAKQKSIPIDRAIAIAKEIATALGAVHGADVVHRDLKPENIYLCDLGDGREQVKVLDFGVAKVRGGGAGRPTQQGEMLGTPHYMSPEQLTEPSRVDPRSDIFALGCMLYEMLAGQLPYAAPVEAMRTSAKPLHSLVPEVPAALDSLVMRMIDVRLDRRPESMAQVVSWLAEVDVSQPIASVPKLVDKPPSLGAISSPDLARAVAKAERAGSGWRWFFAIVLTLAAIAGAGWAWLRMLE